MVRPRNDHHAKKVEAWKQKNSGLSPSDQTQLFILGLQAVRTRALMTLSGVTVSAVIDRTLHECQEKHPALSFVATDALGLRFGKVADQNLKFSAPDIHLCLQEFLIELLDVFGKITADILTKNLHQELMRVTIQSIPVVNEMPLVLTLVPANKKKEQK